MGLLNQKVLPNTGNSRIEIVLVTLVFNLSAFCVLEDSLEGISLEGNLSELQTRNMALPEPLHACMVHESGISIFLPSIERAIDPALK